MDDDKFKNDIKTLFLIANSFNGVVGGMYPLALCVIIVLSEGWTWPGALTLGLGALMAASAALGYYAAFHEKKKMLYMYSSIMGVVAALDVMAVATSMLYVRYFDLLGIIFGIVHVGITLAAVSWSVALAKRTPDDIQGGLNNSSRLPCFLKYLGYGLLSVFIFLFIVVYL